MNPDINQMNTEKSKKYAGITQQLNKSLGKLLQSFALNTEWTDIRNWLANLKSLLFSYPSPYIADKILFSKRLNQCMNPILPDKVHEAVIEIHQKLFLNMKESVDGNINDYIRMFAEDLGVYSVGILPYFVHTDKLEHRVMIARIINNYYLDLGKQLIPMLPGLLKALYSVYSSTITKQLISLIEYTLKKLLQAVGRRYMVGCTWSLILKYKDCKLAGMKFLSQVIDRMQYIKGQQQYQQSRGFSDLQEMIDQLQILQKNNVLIQNPLSAAIQMKENVPPLQQQIVDSRNRESKQKVLEHLDEQYQEQDQLMKLFQQDSNSINLTSPNQAAHSPIRTIQDTIQVQAFSPQKPRSENKITQKPLSNIKEEPQISQEDIDVESNKRSEQKGGRSLFQSQAPNLQKVSILLRQQNQVRLDAVPLMMSPGIQQIKIGADDPDAPQNSFPRIGSLVISSLISCLQEQQPLIKRQALDFMFTHLRLKSQRLGNEQRAVLVQALIRLFKKKEVSIIKRVNRWIFGKEDEQGKYVITQKNQFVIQYIIKAFKNVLNTVPSSQQNCTYPLKILQNFYIEHPDLVERTLSCISLDLLRYIFNFGIRSDNFSKTNDFCQQIFKTGKRFLQNLPSYYVAIFRSLGEAFVEGITNKNEQASFESVKYIDFCYIQLMKHDNGYEELEYITLVLDYLTQGLSNIAASTNENGRIYRLYLKDTVLLIQNLVERRKAVAKINKRQQANINQKYLESGVLQLPPERIQYQQILLQRQKEEQKRYISISTKLQQFFVKLGYTVRNFASILEYEETFKLCSMAVVGIQLHLPKQECNVLPRWFNTLQGSVKVTNPLVSLASIQAMIKCLMSQNKHPIYASFKTIIMQEKANKRGIDYQKLALQKLWSLLDFPHMHSKIIDLIVTFSKYFPYEFTQTVKRSFNTHSAPDKQASIQRFSHFWRLTAYKYKDLLAHQQFQELTKVGLFRMLDFLDDTNPLVRHAAKSWLMQSMSLLRRVIQPLLDQLVQGCTDWYQTPKGIALIQNVYDTNQIFSTFRRIRSILANGSYSFLRFIYQAEISQQLDEQRQKITPLTTKFLTIEEMTAEAVVATSVPQRQPVLPRALETVQKKQAKGSRMSYLDLLLILAVKYIQGHAIQSMGVQFYIGNSGVNASAVELVETLLDYIDNPILCQKVLDYIMQHIFKVLGQVVLNKEYIMQVQLINLIRNIFFNSSFRKKGQLVKVRSFFKDVFTNKIFLVSVLDGLNTPFAYVRSQFIAFITMSIPLIADFLDPPECTQCIRHILFTYYRIIKDIGGTITRAVFQENSIINSSENQQQLMTMSKILQLEGRIKQEEKFVRFSDNLKQVGKTNEILSVLHGVQSILNYFYDLNKLNIKELGFQFTNPYTLFDTFKKIVTLGFANSEKSAKLVEKKNFLHNFETCEALLKDLEPVYETILRSWPLSEQFVRIGSQEFSSVGMRSFNFQRFSRYNKLVRQLIDYVEQEKQSIWGKIYCIMQPMFCKFPKQIIDIYLKIWIRQCSNPTVTGKPRPEPAKTQLLMKIMETIIVNNFPTNIVIHAFLQSTAIDELYHYYSTKGSDKKGNVLDYPIDKSESRLLYFLYVYFNYVYLNQKELTYEPLLQIWCLIMKVLKPFQKSRTPLSAIWIIEILNLCAKKYSPKQLLKNQKFKSDLHFLINDKLKYIAAIASRKEVFFFSDPLATKVNFEQQQKKQPYHVVLPLPPTIYDLYKAKPSQRNHTDKLALKQFAPGENSEIQTHYRVYCFKILKKLGLEVLQNTYLPEKAHWVVVRTCEWMDIILPVIEDKATHNQIFAECASEVLYDLLERARLLFIKSIKPKVLDIFNKDDFFICNVNTLNYWAKIIDWVVSMDKNSQTYIEYLNKVSLSSSYFTSQSVQNKRRIKSFERICFILYSGQKDRYANKLKALLEKIADVIKKPQNVHAALLILILFAIRILILRLSEITLNQLFIDIWPMILTLLMQTFSKQLVRVHINNQISKNPNYLLSAIKLIQMISLTNLGQFAHHQWIFITDYFGVDLTVPQITSEMNQHFARRPQLAKIIMTDNRTNTTPFIYRPYLLNYLPQCGINYVPTYQSQENVEYKPKKRSIIVKDSFIRDQSELRLNALILMQYMINLNEFRAEVDWKQVQEVIVNDFISLDSFIHQIS